MLYLNEFVKQIRPNLSDSSVRTYVSNIKTIFKPTDLESEETLKHALSNDKVNKLVSGLREKYGKSVTTLQIKFNVIAVLLMHFFGDEDPRYISLSQQRNKQNDVYTQNAIENEDPKYVKNSVTPEQYDKVIQSYEMGALSTLKSESTSWKNRETLQTWLILMIYKYHAFRSDIANMRMVSQKTLPEDNDQNYCVIFNRKARFVMNEFKTKKTRGRVIIDANPVLNKYLVSYLKYLKKVEPDNKDGYIMFVNKHLTQMTPNQFGVVYKQAFQKELGKDFTLTMNRKRVVSENPAVQEYIRSKKAVDDLADNMMTSSNMLTTVYNQTGKKE